MPIVMHAEYGLSKMTSFNYIVIDTIVKCSSAILVGSMIILRKTYSGALTIALNKAEFLGTSNSFLSRYD